MTEVAQRRKPSERRKPASIPRPVERAGDRGRTGDLMLGKHTL